MSKKLTGEEFEATEEINLSDSAAGGVLKSSDSLWSFVQESSKVLAAGASAPAASGNLNRALARALKAHGVDLQQLEDAEFDVALALTDPQGSIADVHETVERVLGNTDDEDRDELLTALRGLGEKVQLAITDVKSAAIIQHPMLEGEGALRIEAMNRALNRAG